jgi:hypothetical protein
MGGALGSAERATSHTVDEPGHLVRGLAWWWAEDPRLSWPHPPLGQLLATAPGALLFESVEFESMRGWEQASFEQSTFAYWRDFTKARRQLSAARYTMSFLSILLAIYLYEWVRRRYGERLALFTTVLYAANPILLAHAGLMTTDFPVAFFTLVALLQLHDYLLDRSWWRVIPLAAAVGALVSTKHTGIVVAVLLLPPAVLLAIRGGGRFEGLSRREKVRVLTRDAGVVLLVGLLTINAVYKFDDTGLSSAEILAHPEPATWLGKDLLNERDFLPDGLWVPLPFNYVFGAELIRTQNARGHAGYFMGRQTKRGVPGYFPIMLGIKSPTGMLLLLAAGLGLAARRRFRGLPLDVWLHGYFVVFYLALTFNAHVNIGVRHALLVVPSLACLAARAAEALWTRNGSAKWFAAGCLTSTVLGAALAHPRYIASFNWLVGGSAGGHRISVIGEDWGQDVGELGRWQKANDVPVSYYTSHRLRYAEVRHAGGTVHVHGCKRPVPPGHWLAVHLTERARGSTCIPAEAHLDPDVVLNDHIFLFKPRVWQ